MENNAENMSATLSTLWLLTCCWLLTWPMTDGLIGSRGNRSCPRSCSGNGNSSVLEYTSSHRAGAKEVYRELELVKQNQTLGVKRAWAQHRLPSVSAPSEWGKADRGQTHRDSPQAAQFQQGTLRISKSSETSQKKKQQDKSPKTNHNRGYRNRGENYLGGQENHTGYKRGEFETCHGALGRTAKWKTENRKSSGSRSAMSCCFHYCLFS